MCGADIGYSFAPWRHRSFAALFYNGSGFVNEGSAQGEGSLAGGHFGFNCLMNGVWLWGFEADVAAAGVAANLNGFWSVSTPTFDNLFNVVNTQATSNRWNSPWLVTLRGRIGGLASPDTLVYVTGGGLAVAEFQFSTQTTTTAQLFGPGPTGTLPAGPVLTTFGPAARAASVPVSALRLESGSSINFRAVGRAG